MLAGPRLQLSSPQHSIRDYLVFRADLMQVPEIGYDGYGTMRRHPPNLVWPATHEWFVSSEIDDNWTIVGGSRDLVEAILANPTLEAFAVAAADTMTDELNPQLDGPRR